MAWNKDTYYYQNQMKVLSGTDPEPGYTEDDEARVADIDARINANGLYKFVYLIKQKFIAVKNAIHGAWRLEKEEHALNFDANLNDCIEVGNYAYENNKDTQRPYHDIQNRPDGSNVAFTLKVSRVLEANTGRWQDFIQQASGHRWYRRGKLEDGTWDWGPWMLVLTHEEDPNAPINPKSDDGTADDIFLKRKNDFTNGPIGFGKDPVEGTDYSNKETAGADWVKAKIILGEYNYGVDEPSTHYAKSAFKDTEIPKGQIYLQYFNDQTES